MKKIVLAVAAAVGLAFAGPAEAQFALDLKLAYAIPTGNATGGSALSDTLSGALPIEVAGRYRFTPNLSAGVYFQFAPAFVATKSCDPGVSCSGTDVRLGVQVAYAFMPDGSVNPWVSLGTGWEWTSVSASAGGLSGSVTLSGWEYFNVQAGVDFPLSKLFALGPYVGYFAGSYSYQSTSGIIANLVPSGSIVNTAFHGWIQIGAKGTFNF